MARSPSGSATSSSASGSSGSNNSNKQAIDPVLRNALRYTVSAKEYRVLHDYLLSRAPAVKKHTPLPRKYEAIVKSNNDDNNNVATIRLALRLFGATYLGLRGWEVGLQKFQAWRNKTRA